MPDIDSLPDAAVAQSAAAGLLRWPAHHWQLPRWPENVRALAIPFHVIWISLALLYSFRVRTTGASLWVLAAMIVTTFAAIGVDVIRGVQPTDELTVAPLTAAMFWVMMCHGRRRQAASVESVRVSEESERLLALQQRFLQDASHQLRTPITIALGHSELLARELADGPGGARLVVEDTGAGIAPADLANIFDRFATGSRDAGRRGTGLGLALVRAVADGHGGDIAASSIPGQGSRLELILPLRPATITIETSHIDPCRSSR